MNVITLKKIFPSFDKIIRILLIDNVSSKPAYPNISGRLSAKFISVLGGDPAPDIAVIQPCLCSFHGRQTQLIFTRLVSVHLEFAGMDFRSRTKLCPVK